MGWTRCRRRPSSRRSASPGGRIARSRAGSSGARWTTRRPSPPTRRRVVVMPDNVALVRRPSSRMQDGITTHIDRVPADAGLAAQQHAAYVDAVSGAGWAIREVAPADELPDCAFVEDTVVVIDDLAVLTRPGAAGRRPEVAGAEGAIRSLGLAVARIEEPGTLDGGDVLQVGPTVYVGRGGGRAPPAWGARGGRPTAEGIRQLRRHAAPRRRTVVPVRLHGVLHLK